MEVGRGITNYTFQWKEENYHFDENKDIRSKKRYMKISLRRNLLKTKKRRGGKRGE